MIDFTLIKSASYNLKNTTIDDRNNALRAMADSILYNADKIIEQNKIDLENAKGKIIDTMLDRLMLDKKRIEGIVEGIRGIIDLPDPINNIIDSWTTKNGLVINKVSVPFGVIGAIYEARPNVTADICSLCIKTGNACMLKGGKEAVNTNTIMVEIIKKAIRPYIDQNCVELLPSDRAVVDELITAKGYVDLVFPRGGKGLINYVVENAKVPVIETGAGVCHIFAEKTCDVVMTENVLMNAKLSRPAVCNAVEVLLVDKEIEDTLAIFAQDLTKSGVTLHAEGETFDKLKEFGFDVSPLGENGYSTEFDSLEITIKLVDGVKEAVKHINTYGTGHSDVIMTNDLLAEDYFMANVDSACVYANASTRFTDGGCFGFGAELGISTQKLHARGPMGLKEMTSYKYLIKGEGQIR